MMDPISLKKEFEQHIVLYSILAILFQVVFFKENLLTVQRFLGGMYWMFILPGAILTLNIKEGLTFPIRIALGIPVSLVLVGTSSYYLGLLGLHVRSHGWLLPLAIILTGISIQLLHKK